MNVVLNDTQLPLPVAIGFAHALVGDAASAAAARILFIKGPGLTAQRIRPERQSSDVDVWVEEARAHALLAELAARGWHRRPESVSWQLFVTHSVTLVHDDWPCDIDVHHAFPGIAVPAGQAFDTLWHSRELVDIGPVEIAVPDRFLHTVIAILHALRDPSADRSRQELDYIRQRIAQDWSDADRRRLTDAVVRLRSAEMVADVLAPIGIVAARSRVPSAAFARWEAQRHAERHTYNWLSAVLSSPLRDKPGLVLRGLFPSRYDLEANFGDRAATRLGRWQVRAERYLRATRQLLPSVRSIVIERRVRGTRAPTDPPAAAPPGGGSVAEAAVRPTHGGPAADGTASANGYVCHHAAVDMAYAGCVYVFNAAATDSTPLMLDGTAQDIWALLTTPKSTAQIAAALLEEYEGSRLRSEAASTPSSVN